ncbi:GNAT family N-acetyltransferase [Flagellimonas allohymeniacidonis]|uniref:GNAT family N-acetyltransferase n=1 Tax=Flagellimonas allohymeniacidonis TaxID=2517819 RepID=A0A4Q8QDS8_9FLAO|nr:GNAT family N-acetyltransferase [Allomuricauda hymeniacidonis]TAI48565.1 GNAT family N-acetyltransferase [Allomuricauda hymeniacidonis]
MKDQLITSNAFKETYKRFLGEGQNLFEFGLFPNITFVGGKGSSIFQVIGGTLSPALHYQLNLDKQKDLLGKVFILYNVPSYNEINPVKSDFGKKLGHDVIKEYKGFICNLHRFISVDDYLAEKLSKKSLKSFRSRKARLEKCFDISYYSHGQEIDEKTFDLIFSTFYLLLKKKFDRKGEYYESLRPETWKFNRELTFSLLKGGNATLDVVYNKEEPISIRLTYHFDKISHAITPVYDSDYAKFGLGTIGLIKTIEYCMERGCEKFDMGKGEYGYKKNWTDEIYQHEHHIYYDKSSLSCKMMRLQKSIKFRFLQSLRDRGFNDLYHKIRFQLRVSKKKKGGAIGLSKIENVDVALPSDGQKIDINEPQYLEIKRILVDFIYSTQEHFNEVSVYKVIQDNKFHIIGTKKQLSLTY